MAKKSSEKSRELYRYLKVHFSEDFATAITKYLSTDFTAERMLWYIRNTGKCSMEMIVDEMLAILNDRDAYVQKQIEKNRRIDLDKILDRMIFLWRETDEETCSKKNSYEEEYMKALDEFRDKYGLLGKKLQTPEELEANRKRGGGGTVHFMSELPEYKEISEKYMDEEKMLEQYRIACKDEVMDLMKEHFFALWD